MSKHNNDFDFDHAQGQFNRMTDLELTALYKFFQSLTPVAAPGARDSLETNERACGTWLQPVLNHKSRGARQLPNNKNQLEKTADDKIPNFVEF